MPNTDLKIGTRGSDLALYQANFIKDLIADRFGGACELVILKTQGDKDQTRPVQDLGGVGVFVKELERALLSGDVDLAVHSLKDLPTALPEGLCVPCIPIRVSPHEALIVNPGAVDRSQGEIPLKRGARVGTSSLRRKAQLLELRPDLEVVGIRGNVPRRVGLARDEVDAVVLAAAGIDRLELDLGELVRVDLEPESFLPAPGQGALGLETRAADAELNALLGQLNDPSAQRTTETERHLLHSLGAGCSVPLGAYAVSEGDDLVLRATYEVDVHADGSPVLRQAIARGQSPEVTAALALRILNTPPAASDLPDLAGKSVVIARDVDRAADLVRALERAGAEARVRPPTRLQTLEADAGAALAGFDQDGWLLFASVNAVRELEAALGGSLASIAGRRVGAVGSGTARALGRAGIAVDLLAGKPTGAGLAEAFLALHGDARPAVLIPAARGGRAELSDSLKAAGCAVTVLELYESIARDPPTLAELAADVLVLASPSGARATLASGVPGAKIVVYGPTTAGAVEALGGVVAATADFPAVGGVVAAVARALSETP